MMTCEELVAFLMAYLDGELPPDQSDRFERHLSECPACVVYMDTYVATVKLGKAACAPKEDVPEELVRAILAARGGSTR